MTEADVDAELTAIFRRALKTPDIVLKREMETGAHPGWDSIANVEILISCEERWGFEFDAHEIDGIRTYGNLVDAILSHVG
jgi:acyl carrier protein